MRRRLRQVVVFRVRLLAVHVGELLEAGAEIVEVVEFLKKNFQQKTIRFSFEMFHKLHN